MKKIGVSIRPTISGNFQAVTVNRGDWARRVRDVRPALNHVPAMATDHSLIATFMSFDEKGCFIVVARTVTNIELENIAGWIYIPSNLKISGAEVVKAVEKVRRLIASPEVPPYTALESLFGHQEYELLPEETTYLPSPRNGKFALRTMANHSLEELLGEYRFQPYYADYEAIFLLDNPLETINVTDITDLPLEKYEQPEPEEIEDEVEVIEETFEPILETNETIEEEEEEEPDEESEDGSVEEHLNQDNSDADEVEIGPESFTVYSNLGAVLTEGVTLFVNGYELTMNYLFKRHEVEKARITARWGDVETTVTTDATRLPLSITMGCLGLPFDMKTSTIATPPPPPPVADAYDTMGQRQGANISNTPIYPQYQPKYKKDKPKGNGCGKAIITIIITAAIVVIAAFTFKECNNSSGYKNKDTLQAAIFYLDNNYTWDRDEMEQYYYLEGLYDDMNNFNLGAITGYWSTLLEDSSRFSQVVDDARTSISMGYNPKEKNSEGTYNPYYNTSIYVSDYCSWINDDCYYHSTSSY